MTSPWMDLHEEIARWQAAGRRVEFWWRDDDAAGMHPDLARLVALAARSQVPLALAVIPRDVQTDVLALDTPWVRFLQHGCSHTNLAGDGAKKTEFPANEPVEEALARLQEGWSSLRSSAAIAVLVPPWNRISSSDLTGHLAQAGYRGLSRFGPRSRDKAWPGLVQVNTHVDIIDWKGSRGFAGEDQVLLAALQHLRARREGLVDSEEATGWLTHHLVHDAACWNFLERLFAFCREDGGVTWCAAQNLFAEGPTHGSA